MAAAARRRRVCMTPEEAFQAGWDEPCTHGVADPTKCPSCRLTEAEIGQLAVLHRPYLRPTATEPKAA